MKKMLILIIALFTTAHLFGQQLYSIDDSASGGKRYGASWGIKLMNYTDYESDADGTFYAASIPTQERLFPLLSNDLLLFYNTSLNWGLSEFYFDFGFGGGVRYYPLGNDFLSLYCSGEAGTFFFNNLSATGHAGADLDFMINEDASVFMGGEVLYRKSYRLAEYINSDHWYITSKGWGVNGGVRVRFSLFGDGLRNVPKSL